jgi:hypothetical protein
MGTESTEYLMSRSAGHDCDSQARKTRRRHQGVANYQRYVEYVGIVVIRATEPTTVEKSNLKVRSQTKVKENVECAGTEAHILIAHVSHAD